MFRLNFLPMSGPADLGAAVGLLILAVILGGAIGLEREARQRPAGVRTSALICFGSALFTIASEFLARAHGGDPQRIAALIIPGIGFLGAGAIIRDRGGVVGLTSAATIFVVASIGMVVGGGMVWYGVVGTGIVLLGLRGLAWVERRLRIKPVAANFLAFGADPAGMVDEIAALAEQGRHTLNYARAAPAGDHYLVEFGVQVGMGEEAAFLRALRARPLFRSVCTTGWAGGGGPPISSKGWGPPR